MTLTSLPGPLAPLAAYPQFMNYKLVRQANGKTDKIPIHPVTGRTHDAHDTTAHVAADQAARTGLPVAFVFTDSDPFFFLDIDDCLQGGEWTETARSLCATFAGCAVEVSQSGEGLHIFGRIPEALAHGCDNKPLGSQFYTSGRFVALTGTSAIGSADHAPPVETYRSFIDGYFPPTSVATGDPDAAWTTEPAEDWDGPEDDEELITRMLRSRSAAGILGHRVTPAHLWAADPDALGVAFPDTAGDQGRAFDWSVADAALCSHLAFWTGKDCERMDRIFRLSALMRDKWDARGEYYSNRTILRATSQCRNVYQQRRPDAPTPDADASDLRTGFQYFTAQDQQGIFDGCCYVRDVHRVFVPDGSLLKPDQFRAVFGGRIYALDALGSKTTRNAWEVFTESQALTFPRAHSTCFRPELSPGEIIDHEGRRLINTYVPVVTARAAGDPGPFLDLLARLLPAESDRGILLAYMAACVQHVGIKFQWAPLLQGVQGNGKSFMSTCLTKCLGERYTHVVDPKDMGNIFNSWLSGNLLVVISEVYTRDRRDTIETLKWMITDDRVPSQAKGADQHTGDNRANFFMSSNHKDAVSKTQSDRRFCVFYTAQQEFPDLARDGMSGGYFPGLYGWARDGGYAIINGYLHDYAVPDALNPATTCHRAPVTTSTPEAIQWSLGSIEQEVIEATEAGRAGFCGGWISSMAFDQFMDDHRVRIPLNKRREILKDLGYVPHPALTKGRVNNVIPLENGKPRLYIRRGHTAQNITSASLVARTYQEAQGYVVVPGGGSVGAVAGGGEVT